MRALMTGLIAFAALLLSPLVVGAQLWCVDTDALRVEFDPGLLELRVHHAGAMYNCCPGLISYEATMDGETIFVTEHVTADPPCDCLEGPVPREIRSWGAIKSVYR